MIGRTWKRCEALRASVLIGRGLDNPTIQVAFKRDCVASCPDPTSTFVCSAVFRVRPNGILQSSGGYSAGDTPVPIPNTAVKARSAEGTASYQRWKSRSPPDTLPRGSFPSWEGGLFFAFPGPQSSPGVVWRPVGVTASGCRWSQAVSSVTAGRRRLKLCRGSAACSGHGCGVRGITPIGITVSSHKPVPMPRRWKEL